MTLRGKYRSLTLINWNGFFARTFDLDALVTTLSGGNGAGKSTTMAAFITALIPDLTLLHFRNTTEAGATSGSRDKGLHGKLRPGVCYSVLEIVNSASQRILCGVRLQQIAGKDKKVDIKPFIIQSLDPAISPIALLTEMLDNSQAKVISLSELKDKLSAVDGVIFKQFNSITDYHAMMFDLGILSKRLRTSSDRSKYYRLIEASLYGGISSAITRSLRDYLLTENVGVRKAFHDMESALRENRMTLNAIAATQADRDLFKHLIADATQYVAADYMRNINERKSSLSSVLQLRKTCWENRAAQVTLSETFIENARELQELKDAQNELEIAYQSAGDRFNVVQNALRQQEKIERYQEDVDDLEMRIEEQSDVVEALREELTEIEMRKENAEEEVDEIKTQLSDYQQALDSQQTRAIQYQQALQAFERAKALCQLDDLSLENMDQWRADFSQQEQTLTESLLQLEQRVNLSKESQSNFNRAYQLTQELLDEPVSREAAYQAAHKALRAWSSHCYQAERLPALQHQLTEARQRLDTKHNAEKQLDAFNKRLGLSISAEALDEQLQETEMETEIASQKLAELREQRLITKQELEQLQTQQETWRKQAPLWHIAKEQLEQLQEQSQTSLGSAEQVTAQMQLLLEKEREISLERDAIGQRKNDVDRDITRLSQPSGSEDGRLIALAEQFNGVLLSEIYDDISIDDAPYFSALYGGARNAIVVPHLEAIREQLNALEECPDDLYFIEGDVQNFDDNVFDSEEMPAAVLVKTNDRQWRYSRFPEVSSFGRAAREKRLEELYAEREILNEQFAKLSFEVQKIQRLHRHFSQFIGVHLHIAFDVDPDVLLQQIQTQRVALERALSEFNDHEQQYKQRLETLRESVTSLNKLLPLQALLLNDELALRAETLAEELETLRESADYVKRNARIIQELEPIYAVLQNDPEQNDVLLAQYEAAKAQQQRVKQQVFALIEITQRRAHFSYADAAGMINESSALSNKLKQRLERAEIERNQARDAFRQLQQKYNDVHQTLMSLKSAYESKRDMLSELTQELAVMDVRVEPESYARAQQKRDEMQLKLEQNRQLCHQLETQLALAENDMQQRQKEQTRLERDYRQLRQQVVATKAAWCKVMTLVKANNMSRRLYRRDYAYLDLNELRSMSDKALGSLRLAIADNEHLRDVLRESEDSKYPEKKILFFMAVYQHLRDRIRQDIVQTDDPIEAIEQMEVELSRLTDELTSREQKLAISAKSVANIIRKTIQREQNRILVLNKGLQSVAFGQVHSVRLNVRIRETHEALLHALADEHNEHQALFNNNRYTFSEALAKLFQRLHPYIETSYKSPQIFGEELLDYRNYLELNVEVNRGTEGWLRAESGALSTGEAIGTGMSILVMVVQSWEEESKRLRGRDMIPCRLLFLDEAARLDATSIATLFELCERLEMQLIIAAPENISPEKGTTYKLVRKVLKDQEYVHVVGLKGFA